MRFLPLVLLGLCILALFVLAGLWIGCSPSRLLCDLRTLLTEAQRDEVLRRENRVVLQRIEDQLRVLEALEAGNLTLFEAAKSFERIGMPPAGFQDGHIQDIPRDEAGWCRRVLRGLKVHLAVSPSRYQRALPPLLQAYRQRFGELPDDLTHDPPSFPKPASHGG